MLVPELETARLRLRGFVPEDLDALFAVYRDPEVMRYIGDGQGKTREETATRLADMIRHWEEHGFGRWAVIDKTSDALIGRCGLSYMDNTPAVELGYVLAKPYWGRGLTTEASRACLKYGFEELKLEQIVAIAQPANGASYRVMEKVGMKFVRMAHYYKTDVVYYALSREAYLGQRSCPGGQEPPPQAPSASAGPPVEAPRMIYDLTPAISEQLRVWPGDTRPSREVLCDMRRGDNITLSTLHATVHLGAHADAPNHYGAGAPAMHERSLDYYLGPCQVVRVAVARGACVTPALLQLPVTAERLLLATDTYPDPGHFNEDFAALSPELVELLHGHGVKLVGVDTPSVDLFSSKDLPVHKTFLKHDMAILEGLVLKDVPPGLYELIALPLKLVGFDASPVRAVLRSLSA